MKLFQALKTTIILLLIAFITSCEVNFGFTIPYTEFVRGADISWLSQMEKSGYIFYNKMGEPEDCLKILKAHDINAVRLRSFVNPSKHPIDGHCSTEETIELALRAKNEGMRVLLNLHYSDSWADPGRQNKPAAWYRLSFEDLKAALYDYTYDYVRSHVRAGVIPEWVQTGNEISSGILFPDGKSDTNFAQLAELLNTAYDAVKNASPTTKVILHLDRGHNNNLARWWFDQAEQHNISYDIIGLSYYPYSINYRETIGDLTDNMNDISKRYNKPVMIVETGAEDGQNPAYSDVTNNKIINESYNMIRGVIDACENVKNNLGLGLFYWEPQGARSWTNYPLSAWGENGQPTMVLEAFLK